MKQENLKNKSHEERMTLLRESQEKVRSLQFNLKLGKVQDTTSIRKAKRMIARVLTMMRHGEKS